MPSIAEPLRRVVAASMSGRYRALCDGWTLADGSKRMYFYHIRKTAGTSLNQAMLGLGAEDGQVVYDRMSSSFMRRAISGDKCFAAWSRPLIEQGFYYYAFSHQAAHGLRMPAGTHTITCLRDPVKRVISHYRMLVEYERNDIDHPCMQTEGPWIADGFGGFLEALPKRQLLAHLYMFSREMDVAEALDGVLGCSTILFLERFQAGLEALGELAGQPIEVRHEKKPTVSLDLADDDLARCRELLDDEYRLIEQVIADRGSQAAVPDALSELAHA